MRRRVLILSLLLAALGGSTLAFASTLNGVTAQSLTVYAAASTVPTSSCSSNPTQDTWIDAAHTNTQHATSTTLQVTNGSKPTYALVQFAPCASANAAIVSASLQMRLSTAPGSTRIYGAYPISSSWAETVTWRTTPTISGSASATATTGSSGSTTSWSLVGDVQSIVNGGANNGWAIEDTNNTGAFTGTYDSREGTNPPVLALTYYP
ncbi:MAG: CBM96 family carbohydrate-binding protein [Gaiellaceae bacterium]